jgi:hypothetical protein
MDIASVVQKYFGNTKIKYCPENYFTYEMGIIILFVVFWIVNCQMTTAPEWSYDEQRAVSS